MSRAGRAGREDAVASSLQCHACARIGGQMLNLSTETQTVFVLVGALFLLIGLLGGGLEISAIKVPSAGTPQRFVLGLVGAVLIAVGGANMLDSPSGESSSPVATSSAGTTSSDSGSGASTNEPAAPAAGSNDAGPQAGSSGSSGGDK